ncbi:trans-sulfuration enzyme family protein [Alkalihalobacterium chitinilyticum]|uniref:Aminotransferase class I/II-fold pyridoxal phosphate-dependent enzyme n=1 Tax=Alkalihalobacterium chitinilyticum TaxID=2980103 RepID=A0ABT5VL61_9BACI|nr:aminotransferase class I/II-fold pyridoxal phosphate-dependent enzyme [Alkalihalobacterium chitinilyticum]MDE5416185.1 aminotransferase class I/II-fold pyridoxal phosphate-dependent enzyme [Alkalihalobacterium chitinilyticum]
MGQRFNTRTVHFQSKDVARNMSKAQPIYQTSAFTFKDLEDMESFYQGEKEFLYSRFGNPNTEDLGKGVAAIEEAEDGVATSSGMSAILAGILAVVKPGEHIVASEDLYGGTYQLLAVELHNLGIEVNFVSFESIEEIKSAVLPTTKLIYTESVTNPLLRVENLEMVKEIADEFGLITMIDNTFATPYLLQPTTFGADLVVHSATKYIGGHSDVTAGVLVGKKELIEKARGKVVSLGCNLSPFEAWLACRGLKTLSIRMERQSKNALALANALKSNEGVLKVYYPADLSAKGNGAMVSIELDQTVNVEHFFKSLEWIKIAPTLAGVETTVSYPIRTSHRTIPEATREKLGITEGLVRISIGIEDELDIIETFENAIAKAKG